MSFKLSKKYFSFVKACKNDSREISEKENRLKVSNSGLIFVLYYYTCYENYLNITFFAIINICIFY